MKRNLIEIYALAVCFVTVACFVVTLASFVPGTGSVLSALGKGALAGSGGNAVGQLIVNSGTDNFNFTQAGIAGIVGGSALVAGNITGFNAALSAAQGGAGTAQALAIGESVGGAVTSAIETSATLTSIGLNSLNQNNNECGCGNP